MFAAAVVFPQGIHSDHSLGYFVLAMGIDSILYAGLSYALLTRLFAHAPKTPPALGAPGAVSGQPVKGVIYTDFEVEEFKRRGLM